MFRLVLIFAFLLSINVSAEEAATYDDYYEAFYEIGPVTIELGEVYEFDLDDTKHVKAETYEIKLTSLEDGFATLEINGSSQRVERRFDYSVGRLMMKGIGYDGSSVTLVIGDMAK